MVYNSIEKDNIITEFFKQNNNEQPGGPNSLKYEIYKIYL